MHMQRGISGSITYHCHSKVLVRLHFNGAIWHGRRSRSKGLDRSLGSCACSERRWVSEHRYHPDEAYTEAVLAFLMNTDAGKVKARVLGRDRA